MYHYRQVLLRLGDSDREIAREGLMGRRKVAALRAVAATRGWLDASAPLPEDAVLARELRARKRAAVTSSLEPHAAQVRRWAAQGIQGTTIYSALVRNHGYRGSYSSVRRFLQRLEAATPAPRVCSRSRPAKPRRSTSVSGRGSPIP